MFYRLKKESRNIIKEVLQLVYFMRGAVQYHDMLMMTYGERDLISDFIKERLEQESGKMNPTY